MTHAPSANFLGCSAAPHRRGESHTGRRLDPDLFGEDPRKARRRGDHQLRSARLLNASLGGFIDLLNVMVPIDCVCCGAEDAVLCSGCARRVRQLCRQPFRAEQESPVLVNVDGTSRLGVVAAGPYRDELAQCLLSFKRLGQWRVAGVLAVSLSNAVQAALAGHPGYQLVPVPTSGKAYRKRGFSPVHLILRSARMRALLRGYPTLPALKKVERRHGAITSWFRDRGSAALAAGLGQSSGNRATGQKGLGRGERARRVRGTMKVRRRWMNRLAGKQCLLIDDVLTTGATLAEAARALTEAGGIVCGAVVVAATRPPAYDPSPELSHLSGSKGLNQKIRD